MVGAVERGVKHKKHTKKLMTSSPARIMLATPSTVEGKCRCRM
jgi:hypothetical protein